MLCCDGRVVNASDQGRMGHPVPVSRDSSYKLPPLDVNGCLGVFLACYSQRFEDKRTTGNSQLYYLH